MTATDSLSVALAMIPRGWAASWGEVSQEGESPTPVNFAERKAERPGHPLCHGSTSVSYTNHLTGT